MNRDLSAFVEKIKTDAPFRIKLFLCLSFLFNIAYSIFLFIVARIYSSKWFFVISVYYGLLSLSRLFVFRQSSPKKTLVSKIKTMRVCGYFLLFINLVFSTMTFILIYGRQHAQYHEITVITLATYTFTSLKFSTPLSLNTYLGKMRKFTILNFIRAASLQSFTNGLNWIALRK